MLLELREAIPDSETDVDDEVLESVDSERARELLF